MAAQIISGRQLSAQIREKLKEKVAKLKTKFNKVPKLVVILVGNNPASISYVTRKERDALDIGFASELITKPATIKQSELLELITTLNNDDSVNGILVQLPLPKHINMDTVLDAIKVVKDVDGFHPLNVGNFYTNKKSHIPCTPKGIMTMLKSTKVSLAGKKAIVVGRSNIVGKPIAMLLLNEHATVTIAHSKTNNLNEQCKEADIIIAAIGRERMIKANWVKEGAIVIDVGINRIEVLKDGIKKMKLVGDVDYDNVKEIAGYITPVPGGVGPMTIASLLENTYEAFIQQN